MVYLTEDIIPAIARVLQAQRSLHSLSTLSALNKETCAIVSTILYSDITFSSDAQLGQFLRGLDPFGTDVSTPTIPSTTKDRRKACLNKVISIRIDEPPSSTTASLILNISEQMPLHHLFPSAKHLSIHSNAIKRLPTRPPSTSYNPSRASLKIHESIRRLCRPDTLQIIRPPTYGVCPAYREMHTYFVTSKGDKADFFKSLKDYWPELRAVHWGTIHVDESFAVLGVENVYEIPDCDCVKDEKAFVGPLFASWYDRRRIDDPTRAALRIRAVLKGNRETVERLKESLDEKKNDIFGDGLRRDAMYSVELMVTP